MRIVAAAATSAIGADRRRRRSTRVTHPRVGITLDAGVAEVGAPRRKRQEIAAHLHILDEGELVYLELVEDAVGQAEMRG